MTESRRIPREEPDWLDICQPPRELVYL